MVDAVERIFNLVLYLACARGPVTADQVRSQVAGYSPDQDDAAFARMFERDKDELRRSGFTIRFDEERQIYSLDRAATFATSVELSDEEASVLRVVGSAFAEDPSFPFAHDLRLALTKLAASTGGLGTAAPSRLADEDPATQGALVAALSDAVTRRKITRFGYTNSTGSSAPHDVEPYGLFSHHGRWYVVGRDRALDEVRTYAVGRMSDVVVESAAPKRPDFERPADFEISTFIRLPFEFGADTTPLDAVVRFDSSESCRAESLSAGHGSLVPAGDAVEWHVDARSRDALMRFVVENGPGLTLVSPPDLAEDFGARLAEVAALHG